MKIGSIVGVCASAKRGTSKKNIGKGYLKAGYGLEGDGHFGTNKQISILLKQYADKVEKKYGFKVKPGDFAENIQVEGLEFEDIKVGTLLKAGESLLEVVEIGKTLTEPHTFSFHGMAILVDIGIFCKVIESGKVKVGDKIKIFHTP